VIGAISSEGISTMLRLLLFLFTFDCIHNITLYYTPLHKLLVGHNNSVQIV